jgi:hypothetical protein
LAKLEPFVGNPVGKSSDANQEITARIMAGFAPFDLMARKAANSPSSSGAGLTDNRQARRVFPLLQICQTDRRTQCQNADVRGRSGPTLTTAKRVAQFAQRCHVYGG